MAFAQTHVKSENVRKCFLRYGFNHLDSQCDEQKIDNESKIDKELIHSSHWLTAISYVTLNEIVLTHGHDLMTMAMTTVYLFTVYTHVDNRDHERWSQWAWWGRWDWQKRKK